MLLPAPLQRAIFAALPTFLLAGFLTALSSAQIELSTNETAVRWAAGRPMLRATLRADDKVYTCHLLLDLASPSGLVLHRNAASVLKSESCRVEAGNLVFEDLPFTARRDEWMEAFTRDHAEALQEVPVAGAIGLGAFEGLDLWLDGPAARLRCYPAQTASDEVENAPQLCAVELLGNPKREGLRFEMQLEGDRRERFGLHSREEFSWIDAQLAADLGHPDGVLRRARNGRIDFAARTPFRPIENAARKGSIGAAVLQGLVTRIQIGASRIVFDTSAPLAYPEDEAAYYRARYGVGTAEALQVIATKQPPGRFAAAAAEAWLEIVSGSKSSTAEERALAFLAAGKAAIAAAPVKGRATRALKLLEDLPYEDGFQPTRRGLAEAGLAAAREDEDGTAAFKLRIVLGREALQRDDLVEAKRHLLAAVFGMPTAGAAHLSLAELHGRAGEWEMARARSFQALLDARETGPAGYLSFLRAHRELEGQDADPLPMLEEFADGRVPYFEALPRDEGTIAKTGKTVLVELFTGAMCPPCVAADLAVDAASKHYGADEVVIVQYHLPIPAPDPLFSPVAATRAQGKGVRATPTTFVDGVATRVNGGKQGDAPNSFRALRIALDETLLAPPAASLKAHATLESDTIQLSLSCTPTDEIGAVPWRLHAILVEELVVFPGSNGILFHHQVARAALTPPRGIAAIQAPSDDPWTGELILSTLEDELEMHLEPFEEREPFLVRPTDLHRDRLHIVCFAEDPETGRVIQAHQVAVSRAAKESGR